VKFEIKHTLPVRARHPPAWGFPGRHTIGVGRKNAARVGSATDGALR
jgi:hypothetical protein